MEKWPIYQDVSFEVLFPFRVLEIAGVDCASAPHWHGCMEFVFIEKGVLSVLIGGENRAEDGEFYRGSKKLFKEILDEYRRGETGFKMAIRAKLMEVEVLYFRSIVMSPSGTSLDEQKPKNIQRLERIFEYIHHNFDEPELSAQQAAEAAGVSVNYFVRFFQQQSGQYFHDYLVRLRLSHAKKELLASDRPVTDIAYDCGFNSIQTFNRLFKVHTGLTPLAFRNNKRLEFES